MANPARKQNPTGILVATAVVLATIAWLGFTGTRDNKDYYVTISELQGMGPKAYTRHLRVAGNVQSPAPSRASAPTPTSPSSSRAGPSASNYHGSEPPPDTFKDDAQALAVGTFGHDGVFHATQLQAKCASKYAAQPPRTTATALPTPR